MLNDVLWNRQITRKKQIYNSIVKSTVTYRAETWRFNKNLESILMLMQNGLSEEISEMFKIRNNVISAKANVKNSVLAYIRYKQLNWYGHVQRMITRCTHKSFRVFCGKRNK